MTVMKNLIKAIWHAVNGIVWFLAFIMTAAWLLTANKDKDFKRGMDTVWNRWEESHSD